MLKREGPARRTRISLCLDNTAMLSCRYSVSAGFCFPCNLSSVEISILKKMSEWVLSDRPKKFEIKSKPSSYSEYIRAADIRSTTTNKCRIRARSSRLPNFRVQRIECCFGPNRSFVFFLWGSSERTFSEIR